MKTRTINEYTVVVNGMDKNDQDWDKCLIADRFQSKVSQANDGGVFGEGNIVTLRVLGAPRGAKTKVGSFDAFEYRDTPRTREELEIELEGVDIYVAFGGNGNKERGEVIFQENLESMRIAEKKGLAYLVATDIEEVRHLPARKSQRQIGIIAQTMPRAMVYQGVNATQAQTIGKYWGNPENFISFLAYAIKGGLKEGFQATDKEIVRNTVRPLGQFLE